MKNLSWIIVFALLAALTVPALAQDDEMEMEAWTCPEGFEGETLSVYNWATYIAEDTIPNFEEACGVTVEYTIFESSEQALAILRQGNPGYDVVVPSDYIAAIMFSEELVMELDREMIPNLENLSPGFTELGFDEGNIFSVPYQWGTIGIGYNTEALPDGVESWADVWAYEGDVSWLEDPRSMLGIGLVMLGYDPNTTNTDEIEEAAEYLIDNGDNVVAIAGDDGQALLERGDVDIAVEYNGDIYQVMFDCECDTYAYAVPAEGTVIWTDAMVVPADAPNPELAHAFIDYILDPQVGAELSNFTAYGSPNGAAIEAGLIDPILLEDPGIYPSEETQENLFAIEDLPEIEETVTDSWDEVKIEVGS